VLFNKQGKQTSIDICSQTQLSIFVLFVQRLAMYKHLLVIQILIVVFDCIYRYLWSYQYNQDVSLQR